MVSMNEVQEGVYRIENNLDKSKNTIFLRQEYIALPVFQFILSIIFQNIILVCAY